MDQATMYVEREQWDRAATTARQCLRQDPTYAPALLVLAQALTASGDDDAVRTGQQAVEHLPEAHFAWIVLANALTGAPDPTAAHLQPAVDAAQRAVQLAPQAAEAHRTLALMSANAACLDPATFSHMRAVAFDAALQAVRLDPHNATSHAMMAWAYHASGDHRGTEQALRQGLRIDPTCPVIKNIQGMVNLDNAHTTAAVASFAGILRADPTRTDASDTLDQVAVGGVIEALPVLGLMALTVTCWTLVAMNLLVDVGWLHTGREVALGVWVVGAAACAGLLRHLVRSCSWRQVWARIVALKLRRVLVVPGLLAALALLVVASPEATTVPLVLLALWEVVFLFGWARALYHRHLDTRHTRAV